MKTRILSLALTILSVGAVAQSFSNSTLIWTADQVLYVEQADTVEMNCSFKSISQNQLEWSQRNGTINSIYQVTGVEGAWSDVYQNGSITLTLLRNGKTSKATFEKSAQGTFVTMDLSRQGTSSHLRFRIVSVE